MHVFLHRHLNEEQLKGINKYLKSRDRQVFTKALMKHMTSKNDPLRIMDLEIVVLGNWFEFDANASHESITIRHRQSDDTVDEEQVKYIIALQTAISGFDGLCLDKDKKPLAIMSCAYDDEGDF